MSEPSLPVIGQISRAVVAAKLILCGELQVLVSGKISQAIVIAAAAYRSESQFQQRTGISQSVLISDEHHTKTHVSLPFVTLTT